MNKEDPYDRLRNLDPKQVALLKAERDKRSAVMDQSREAEARKFKFRDSVSGSHRTPDGRIDPNSDLITIRRWSNDYGDAVYVRSVNEESNTSPSQDQIKALADSIQTQKADFNSLDPSEQTRLKTDNRFGAYFNNEALAAQFKKLK